MPFLHFHGQFKFQYPYYNNFNPKTASDPDANKDPRVLFKEDISEEDFYKLRTNGQYGFGGDPTQYFLFEFLDVKVTKVTYDDGIIDKSQDLILNKTVALEGVLADVSPILQQGRLYVGALEVKNNLVKGMLSTPIQSAPRLRIRDEAKAKGRLYHYSADFDTRLYNIFTQKRPDILNNSRYLREIGNPNEVKIYIHLSLFDYSTTIGYVSGYIGTSEQLSVDNEIRLNNRPLIFNSTNQNLTDMIKNDFKLDLDFNHDNQPDGTDDIRGQYDILNRLLVIHYLDCVPIINVENLETPTGYKYTLYFLTEDKKRINISDNISETGFEVNYDSMKDTGGILIFNLPNEELNFDNLSLVVGIRKNGQPEQPLMLEPERDIMLQSERGIVMGSAETREIIAKTYHRNKLEQNSVYFKEDAASKDQPIVVKFKDKNVAGGKITATIEAIDLDPPLNTGDNSKYPWNTYYGNYVTMYIKDTPSNVGEVSIPVRVLHVVKPEKISSNDISFENDIKPLFSYYIRYYPWLHAKKETSGKFSIRLDLGNYDDVKANIDKIIEHLEKDDGNKNKMPRSRDFPIGGIKLIKQWQKLGMP